MTAPRAYSEQAIRDLAVPPAPNTPQGVPIPGTETENRTAIYRNFRFRDGLLTTFDPAVQSTYDLFEQAAKKYTNSKCLGTRPWNAQTKTWENKYVWQTYGEVSKRYKALGAGLVEVHKEAGITAEKCGVGLWAQNRAEWQIAGT